MMATEIGHREERSDDGSRLSSGDRPALQALLTMHCAECDYSLVGLPRDAKCPECGTAIDDRFVIVRGYVTGRGANVTNARPWMMPLLFFASGGGIFFQALMSFIIGGVARSWPLMLMCMVPFGIAGMMTLRRLNMDGPPAQLWLAEEGYWVRSRIEWLSQRKQIMLASIVGLLIGLGLVIAAFSSSAALGIFATIVFLIVCTALTLIVRRERKDSIELGTPAYGTRRFYKWRSIRDASISVRADGWATIVFDPMPPTFWDVHRQQKTSFLFEPTVGKPSAIERFVIARIGVAASRVS